MKSAATQLFVEFKKSLAEALAPLGFLLHGNSLSREKNGVRILIELQRDAKYGTKEALRFTLNVGLMSRVLQDFDNIGVETPTVIPESDLWHWRSRLGQLLPDRTDRWWEISDDDSEKSVREEVVDGILAYGLPKLEPLADVDQLIMLWKSGQGAGLTEYRRRRNLARLLVAQGRTEEALDAVRELSEASIGKSWEVAARYDVKVLKESFQ
ncbi:DUF4304 domain-containing protein [Mitsuaria sp. 7]|uniref:DUF4304 domain-containing protein n=1 Tax=Mitsuaria sp. 7 TaxID=1658665 RepID=UPI0009EF637C|nr:DUF4304 domain-containing protein [Mitsuaria sp. 7]